MTVLTAYNRTNMKMMFVMTAFFFVVCEGLFRIMLYNTVAKVRTYELCVVCVVVRDGNLLLCASFVFSALLLSLFSHHSHTLPPSLSFPSLLPSPSPLTPSTLSPRSLIAERTNFHTVLLHWYVRCVRTGEHARSNVGLEEERG
jgi:hypothetical protein